jgi:hypothetical protein
MGAGTDKPAQLGESIQRGVNPMSRRTLDLYPDHAAMPGG